MIKVNGKTFFSQVSVECSWKLKQKKRRDVLILCHLDF